MKHEVFILFGVVKKLRPLLLSASVRAASDATIRHLACRLKITKKESAAPLFNTTLPSDQSTHRGSR